MYAGVLVLALTVFIADMIKSILSINLFIVALIIFVGYTVVRGIIQAENTEAKKKILKYVGIAVGGIGAFSVIVNFFGVIGIIAALTGVFLASSDIK